jgi:exopolyphosphatase/guanosine-5'-triphosphate,3'-diphosphate pyrophosphatase
VKKEQPAAVIDLGTNTARLLIGTVSNGTIVPQLLKRIIVRLGGGFSREEGLSAEAQQRALSALKEFAADIQRFSAAPIRTVATSAVRDAINGAAFCREVQRQTGITLEVIEGEEEGLLTLGGVLTSLACRKGNFFVFDVGGGSTEYTVARGEEPLFTRSLPLGVVRLTEGKGSVAAITDKIDRELGGLRDELAKKGVLPLLEDATLVGTAGTVTTLAAISLQMTDYDYHRVNNHVLTHAEVQRIYELLLPLSPAERLSVPGLEKGREDLIIAGTLLTLRTMELFSFPTLTVSDFGLLEGLLVKLHEGA